MERFNSVAETLKDPNSKPEQYIIKHFGHCDECRQITEIEASLYKGALICKTCYTQIPESYSKNLPEEIRTRLENLHSKNYQKLWFNKYLEEFLNQLRCLNLASENTIEKASALKHIKTITFK